MRFLCMSESSYFLYAQQIFKNYRLVLNEFYDHSETIDYMILAGETSGLVKSSVSLPGGYSLWLCYFQSPRC